METKDFFSRVFNQIQTKNIIVGLIMGITLMLAVFWVFTGFDFGLNPSKSVSPVTVPKAPELVMGAGWSKNPDEKEAVQEAFAMMQEQMNGRDPNFIIITSESGYNNQVIAEQLSELLIPSARIYGWTSMIGSVNPVGLINCSMMFLPDFVSS